MAKYRKKHPDTVEAVRFDPTGEHRLQLPAGVLGMSSPNADNWGYSDAEFWMVSTLGVRVPVVAGDWIVTEPDGKQSSRKDEHFRSTYEPAD
jgi:hypothetical protein